MKKTLAMAVLVTAFAALYGVWYVGTAEGGRYARWSNGEAYHKDSYSDGYVVGLLVAGAVALMARAVFLIMNRLEENLRLAEEIEEEGTAVEVAEVIAVDPGEVQAMLTKNPRLFDAETARKVLLLLGAEGERARILMESTVGFEAIRRPGKAYLVCLTRRSQS